MLVAALLLAGTVCLVQARAVHSPFIFDDDTTVLRNTSIRSLWPLFSGPDGHGPLNPPLGMPMSARPLVNLSLAVNYYFGGLDPFGYHLFNIVLHAMSALLLAAIVYRTLRLDFFQGRFAAAAGPLALASGLLWGLHPLTTETVAYTTQRTEALMGLCYLATLWAAQHYWSAQRPLARGAWWAAAAAACLLGSLSKEVMASAPLVVLLYERTFVAGSFKRACRQSWPLYLGLLAGLSPLAAFWMLGMETPMAGFDLGTPAHVWWLTQTKVLFLYLKLSVWPWPLALHYEIPLLTNVAEAWPWLLAAILFGGATVWFVWRRKATGFVAAWLLLVLSPTLLIPMSREVAVERRMYVPLAALAAWAVVGGYSLLRRLGTALAKRRHRAATGTGALAVTLAGVMAVAAAYGVLDVRRLAEYDDELMLWQSALRHQGESPQIEFNVGELLRKAGRSDEAFAYFERAARPARHLPGPLQPGQGAGGIRPPRRSDRTLRRGPGAESQLARGPQQSGFAAAEPGVAGRGDQPFPAGRAPQS